MSGSDDIATPPPPDEEMWLSIAALAVMKGVSRQTVWEKVERLERQGLLATKPGPGGTRLVNVGEYDYHVKETADLVKEQAAATLRASQESPELRRLQEQKMRAEAALKDVELRERTGQLVDITRVEEVIAEVGEELRKPIEQLPLRAEEISAAAVSGGVQAVRGKLKQIAFELRGAFAEGLRKLDLRSKGGSSPV